MTQTNGIASALQEAVALYARGDFALAERVCAAALKVEPTNAHAMMVRAICAFSLGRLEDAEKWNGRAISANPKAPEAWSNRGIARLKMGKLGLALKDLDQALKLKPEYPEALANRAAVLTKFGRMQEALDFFDRALRIRPAFVDALSGQGYVLCEFGRLTEALAACETALKLEPKHADGWNNLGYVLRSLERLPDAARCFENALAIDPNHFDALYNRGLLRHRTGDYGGAIEDFVRVRKARPEAPGLSGQLLYSRMHQCDWSDNAELLGDCRRRLKQRQLAATPLQVLGMTSDANEALTAASVLASHLAARQNEGLPAATPLDRVGRRPLRVAYISGDFRQHACATMMVELIERHDRSKVIPIGINIGPLDQSEIGRRVRQAFSEFIDVAGRSEIEIARSVRIAGADIAVDLMGHTEFSKPRIFAHRGSSIQVNMMGFPGSTALANMDYILGDPVVTPDAYAACYSEKLCRMPDCYLPTNPSLPIGRQPARAELGLPDEAFVFASFNHNWKITPAVFSVWMRLLASRPGSLLWIAASGEAAQENLRREAALRGIGSERLVFASRVAGHAEHLARLSRADLFLDTNPYTGHSTTCDALLASLPVVTVLGETFASRAAASILTSAGMPELAVGSLQAYEALAYDLSCNSDRLAALRQKVLGVRASPLFDMDRYARNLERAFEHMVEVEHRYGAAQPFDVANI